MKNLIKFSNEIFAVSLIFSNTLYSTQILRVAAAKLRRKVLRVHHQHFFHHVRSKKTQKAAWMNRWETEMSLLSKSDTSTNTHQSKG